MTTKPKARKAPAKPKREASKIKELVARWEWLEAEQDYQTAIAPPECDADRRHDIEQERIVAKLRTLVPQDFSELEALIGFSLDQIKRYDGLRCDRAEIDMLTNAHEASFDVRHCERETAFQNGMNNMRDFLRKETTAAIDSARDAEIMQKIRWGNA
jgi:hypothetical protein